MRKISICVVVGSVLMLAGCMGDATSEDASIEDEAILDEESEIAEVEQAAAAPPLTYLQVKGVYSNKYPNGGYGEQPIEDSAWLTTQDHGGGEMYILTVELGYGYARIAMLGGSPVQQDSSEAIIGAGNVVIGYYRWWKAGNSEGGPFSYESTSLPGTGMNTMYDAINIK